MKKYYHFIYSNYFNKKDFDDIISNTYQGEYEIFYNDIERSGYIYTDDKFIDRLISIHPILLNDLGCSITFLVSHENGYMSKSALEICNSLFSNKITNLCDVLLYTLIKKDNVLKDYLDATFGKIDYDLIQTGLAFIECGMNASLASRRIYVHRNTFNYRLEKFVVSTKLDIRDYNNAMLFYLYEKSKSIK